MNRNELREKIAGTISEDIRSDCSSGQIADDILDILAPILADAEKWKRVERAYNSSPPCDCPEWDSDNAECMIETAHCPFNDVVNALEGEGEKG
jgi:hypothetical protein